MEGDGMSGRIFYYVHLDFMQGDHQQTKGMPCTAKGERYGSWAQVVPWVFEVDERKHAEGEGKEKKETLWKETAAVGPCIPIKGPCFPNGSYHVRVSPLKSHISHCQKSQRLSLINSHPTTPPLVGCLLHTDLSFNHSVVPF